MTDRGERGLPGIQGERGKSGVQPVRAFVIVVVMASLVVSIVSYQATRSLKQANRDSCDNFVTLRDAVNEFHGSFRALLATAKIRAEAAAVSKTASPRERRVSKEAAIIYGNLIKNTHTVSSTCAQNK